MKQKFHFSTIFLFEKKKSRNGWSGEIIIPWRIKRGNRGCKKSIGSINRTEAEGFIRNSEATLLQRNASCSGKKLLGHYDAQQEEER